MISSLIEKWHHAFGGVVPEIVVRAPGRINLIGEHTDYNEGWVMPAAISKSIYIFIGRNHTNQNQWIADDIQSTFSSESFPTQDSPAWSHYIQGVAKHYSPDGEHYNILISGDLPVGAGLSSSSALVCGLLYAFQTLYQKFESKDSLALMASSIEKEIIGLQGGIMDQFAVVLSEDKKVMMLDCRTKTYRFLSAELPGTKWVLINTLIKHRLIESDYNIRASECREAVDIIRKNFPQVKSLRDVTLEMISQVHLPPKLNQRSRFVIEENMRVHEMANALNKKDAMDAGDLMKASHTGLQYDYEVSCPELDHLAGFANSFEGVYGARMMGGGFGGCVICLVEEGAYENFISEVTASYAGTFGFEPAVIEFDLGGGVERIRNCIWP